MLADAMAKTNKSLEDRGIPADSFFTVEFNDGSIITEKEINWSAMSYEKQVDRFGAQQICFVSDWPIKSISVVMGGLEASIEQVPEGAMVFQFMQSELMLAYGIEKGRLLGRGIGLIKDNKVIEEKFINLMEKCVQGAKL